MTHRDGFPRLSARSAWRGDAGHRKPCVTPSTSTGPSESLGKPPPVGQANRRRASESLDDMTGTDPVTVRRIYRKVNPESLSDMAESLAEGLLGPDSATAGRTVENAGRGLSL